MSIDRNRKVWGRASLGREIDEFDFRCVAFGEMLDMQAEISSRQLGFIYKGGYSAANDSSWGHKIDRG